MKLLVKDLIKNIEYKNQPEIKNQVVTSLAFDSRKVEENTMFFAIKGSVADGHQFIEKAIENGAKAIVCEQLPEKLEDTVVYIQVDDSQEAMAKIADVFYGNPSTKLKLVGVTGTNGKTTIASLLYQLFTDLGYRCGLLSTVKIKVAEKEFPTTHTTPDAITINEYLAEMVKQGCQYAFMEVSSHGIAQKRTEALHFAGGIFSNLSHDHLDYHKDFATYRDTKKIFFDQLPKEAFAISNADDKNGVYMLQNTQAKKMYYATKSVADVQIKIIEQLPNAMLLNIDNKEVWVHLIGAFNAANIGAIFSAAKCLQVEEEELLKAISVLKSVSGRFQYVEENKKIGIVDYAHTPDALENVLETINQLRQKNTQVITVVGCGGDRDKTKRPKMAKTAVSLSDYVVLTSDNPRTEDPEKILDDMEEGISSSEAAKYIRITNREQAIKMACNKANQGDIVLVAGKGHETYQEVNGIRSHFDDIEQLKKYLKNA